MIKRLLENGIDIDKSRINAKNVRTFLDTQGNRHVKIDTLGRWCTNVGKGQNPDKPAPEAEPPPGGGE